MEEFQSQCLHNEPKLRSFLVSPKKAHITVLVLHVEEDRLEEAKSIFEHCQDHFSNDNVFDVEFSGIGSFGNRVLFAKPSGNIERIVRLSGDTRMVLQMLYFAILELRTEMRIFLS